jgi:hypothetical protein
VIAGSVTVSRIMLVIVIVTTGGHPHGHPVNVGYGAVIVDTIVDTLSVGRMSVRVAVIRTWGERLSSVIPGKVTVFRITSTEE